ncbi:MAG: VWA domain-containing protein [Pyrinomonadaceae bacterium MAG19_C2-C3]|nr:VWA domain-containing protein [Pyrinomonadaceae bacterium MAG19_C2-C3]
MFNLAFLNYRQGERLRKTRIVFATLIALFFVCLPAQAQQTLATKAASAPTHTIQFTLTAKDGAAVGDLRIEDVQLMESGEVQQITSLVKKNSPIVLTLMFDRSGSFSNLSPSISDIGQALITGVMQLSDAASVVTFTGTTVLEVGITSDIARVQKAISKIQSVGQPVSYKDPTPEQLAEQILSVTTALYDAVADVSTQVFITRDNAERRGIILITDGEDRDSQLNLNQAIRQTQFVGVSIYAIGIGDEKNYSPVNKGVLNKLAEQTGGAVFYPQKPSNLPAVFESMKRDLHSYYELSYTPTTGGMNKGNSREIKLKIVSPTLSKQKLQLNYPRHRVVELDKVK